MPPENKPLCIHAHKINLPLLADFPKSRFDINPFYYQSYFEGRWGTYLLEELEKLSSSNHPILLFLDSFTISNIHLPDIRNYTGEIYLFVGDTQHGPLNGLLSLISLSHSKCISKVFFVNNPQHAHWFARHKEDFKRFFYFPIGFANHYRTSCWEDQFVSNSFIHVGNILSTHKFRKHILDGLRDNKIPIALLRTENYRHANSLHANSKASINISLNSDISFRISEILVSGGLCITDRIGYVQRLNFPFLSEQNIVEFDSMDQLASIILDLQGQLTTKYFLKNIDLFSGCKIDFYDDIFAFSKLVQEPRLNIWSKPGGGRLSSLDSYITTRNTCIEEKFPSMNIHIHTSDSFDSFLDILDLNRLNIIAGVASNYYDIAQTIVKTFKLESKIKLVRSDAEHTII